MRVEVISATAFDIYMNDMLVTSITGESLPASSRFGVWAATDEYLGNRVLVDMFEISAEQGTTQVIIPTAIQLTATQSSPNRPIAALILYGCLLSFLTGKALWTARFHIQPK